MDSLLNQEMDSVSINIKPVFRKYAQGKFIRSSELPIFIRCRRRYKSKLCWETHSRCPSFMLGIHRNTSAFMNITGGHVWINAKKWNFTRNCCRVQTKPFRKICLHEGFCDAMIKLFGGSLGAVINGFYYDVGRRLLTVGVVFM